MLRIDIRYGQAQAGLAFTDEEIAQGVDYEENVMSEFRRMLRAVVEIRNLYKVGALADDQHYPVDEHDLMRHDDDGGPAR